MPRHPESGVAHHPEMTSQAPRSRTRPPADVDSAVRPRRQVKRSPPDRKVSARTQVGVSILVGLLTAIPVAFVSPPEFWPLVGWDTAAIVYLLWVWTTVWPQDAERTARLAELADPSRAAADVLLLSAAVASLVSVGFLLARAARDEGGGMELLRVGLGLTSVVLSWLVVHTTFTVRYAHLYYYADPDGGVNFNQQEPPSYADFAYLAFTVGTTFQVSDTDLENGHFRRTVLRHALLSYLFGTGILAAAINLIASLSSK
jgi:uncharacterized membrane protein